MLNFKYIPLNENLLKRTLELPVSGDVLYLFPTRKSRKEAIKLYQAKWDLSQHKFLTLDEWKESLEDCDQPLLREEKRSLALFQSMSTEARSFFKIDNYHQSIDFSHNFFSFWEEMREEQIQEEEIYEVLAEKVTAEDWQLKCFQQLTEIREAYNKFLKECGFTDKIFIDIQPQFPLEEYSQIVVVNQFYYTRKEKELLGSFPGEVTIVSQIPALYFEEATLGIKADFNAQSIKPFVSGKFETFIASDQYEMIAQLSTQLPERDKATIIDFRFEQQPYAHLLDPGLFSIPQHLSFTATRIFRFWQSMKQLLDSIIWEGSPFLVSIESLLHLICSDDLLTYFTKDQIIKSEIKEYLFHKIDEDHHFLDLEIFRSDEKDLETIFKQIFNHLQNLLKVGNIRELVELITSDPQLHYLLSDSPDQADLAQVFLETLNDFLAIERIDLVNWQKIFPVNKTSNLLQLFLNYLKAKKLQIADLEESRYTITTLQNSRNISYHNLLILNVIEGILPDKKHTQFLFSENQRQKLGLKTYDDITLRDKFYFYQLISSSRNVKIFTRMDPEENIEISSFLEELRLADLISFRSLPGSEAVRTDLAKRIFEVKRNIPLPDPEVAPSFFSFPYKTTDLPDNKLILGFYKWEKFSKSPFEFYLEYIRKLRKREPEIYQDISPKAIGNIGHEIMNLVWKGIISVYDTNKFSHNFKAKAQHYVNIAVQHYFKYHRKFTYLSPHNFSQSYFHKIFLPILIDGLSTFLIYLDTELDLSQKMISVYPETGASYLREFFQYKNINIILKGRPDLRLESENHKFIFDYKTGSSERNKAARYDPQLQFYEMLCYNYYSVENPVDITSYLYFIEQKDLRKLSKRIDLQEKIINTLKLLEEKGYCLAEKADSYEDIELTRRDLYSGVISHE